MISVTSAQLDAWIVGLMLPLARMLGLFATAPLFANKATPMNIRLGIGLVVTLAVLGTLPPMPAVPAASGAALIMLAYQGIIGAAIGFIMRLVFAAVEVAGELIGLQAGLSFAVFFDPQAGGQTAVLTEFLNLLAVLLFVAMDGHLMLIAALVQSFEWLPVSPRPTAAEGWSFIAGLGGSVFATGLLLALPLITALLITNIAMGVLTRAAPQLNLFAVGFPITLTAGFVALILSLNAFAPVMQHFFGKALENIALLLKALAGGG